MTFGDRVLGVVGVVALSALVLVVPRGLWGAIADQSAAACEGPDVDPWVGEFRDRVLSFNSLAHFAIAEFGEPVDCEGAVTTEFDGVLYGTLVLTFPTGVTLQVETQPIETSVVTLRAAAGFRVGASIEAELRAYCAQIGVSIDWDRPEDSTDGDESIRTFRDPDPGLNASASLVTSNGMLVAARFSMAL
jgi:hypothetical protein